MRNGKSFYFFCSSRCAFCCLVSRASSVNFIIYSMLRLAQRKCVRTKKYRFYKLVAPESTDMDIKLNSTYLYKLTEPAPGQRKLCATKCVNLSLVRLRDRSRINIGPEWSPNSLRTKIRTENPKVEIIGLNT